jgi:uncharacterized membrane protein
MRDKMIVVVFDDERKAYEGFKALNDMDAEGSITLYASAVIAKDANGKLTVKQTADEGPLGTGVGLFTGSMIGLLGGPAGVAVGALTGMAGGAIFDLARVGVGGDFLDEVGQQLKPGKVAVVAEIWEEWVMPLDTRMAAVGGIVLRQTRDDFVDAQVERDIASLKAEVADLKAEHARADKEARAKLQAKIDTAWAKLKAAHDRAGEAAEATKREMDAKIGALRGRVAKAKGDAKTKLEARIAEVQADHKRRADKLHQAWELTKEALASDR